MVPGAYMPSEPEMLRTFGVSRPTLREAIRILEVQGLLSVSQGARKGPRVEHPSAERLAEEAGVSLQIKGATLGDVYEARTLIEPLAARLAAERRPKEAAAALREQIEHEYAVLGDKVAVRKAIANFHRILLEQSGNITLAMFGMALSNLVDRHNALVYERLSTTDAREDPEVEMATRRSKFGLLSFERLATLIDAGQAEEASQHWALHMKNAAPFWLQGVSDTSVVDILD